ncbi:MAG: PEP-CTERM sorting domain-containing protein, partial [Pseudomonadota bacterium]|nr:PEP-CTERM sorting domain-containing protein [Pseudomonadota bacterium]
MKKILAALLLTAIGSAAQAATITYSDFSDLSDFQLNGSTAAIGNPVAPDSALRLTNGLSQSGSAFLTNTV